MTDDPDGHELSLVMPFVNVTSKGGVFDDAAFVAGYEVGCLDRDLAAGPAEHVITAQTENREQADLIAMRRGYRAEFQHTDVEGWVWMRFTREQVP